MRNSNEDTVIQFGPNVHDMPLEAQRVVHSDEENTWWCVTLVFPQAPGPSHSPTPTVLIRINQHDAKIIMIIIMLDHYINHDLCPVLRQETVPFVEQGGEKKNNYSVVIIISSVSDKGGVACPLRVGGEVLTQVEEFKYLTCSRVRERWSVRLTGRLVQRPAVMRSVYRTVMVKKELSRKAKLSIYRSIYIPTLTYGHELWVMTERTRSRIQAAEMSFLRRVVGTPLEI
ncbi:hypothetical protein L3Q82_010343, partial [Scortum barcoo]